MGFVMQDPTIFNYSVKENILYGKKDALNSEIRKAAEVANAMEFIESNELLEAVDNTAAALTEAFKSQKDTFVEMVGEERYAEKLEALELILK
mmetsp:Transcript_42725/g.41054  ORF Transcript_42725/g.41054 Transcript_42725/m.41054 type:complete len:93 (+) Transcript_42725:1438-1716(+)